MRRDEPVPSLPDGLGQPPELHGMDAAAVSVKSLKFLAGPAGHTRLETFPGIDHAARHGQGIAALPSLQVSEQAGDGAVVDSLGRQVAPVAERHQRPQLGEGAVLAWCLPDEVDEALPFGAEQ